LVLFCLKTTRKLSKALAIGDVVFVDYTLHIKEDEHHLLGLVAWTLAFLGPG
jgi:hypothetical protein